MFKCYRFSPNNNGHRITQPSAVARSEPNLRRNGDTAGHISPDHRQVNNNDDLASKVNILRKMYKNYKKMKTTSSTEMKAMRASWPSSGGSENTESSKNIHESISTRPNNFLIETLWLTLCHKTRQPFRDANQYIGRAIRLPKQIVDHKTSIVLLALTTLSLLLLMSMKEILYYAQFHYDASPYIFDSWFSPSNLEAVFYVMIIILILVLPTFYIVALARVIFSIFCTLILRLFIFSYYRILFYDSTLRRLLRRALRWSNPYYSPEQIRDSIDLCPRYESARYSWLEETLIGTIYVWTKNATRSQSCGNRIRKSWISTGYLIAVVLVSTLLWMTFSMRYEADKVLRGQRDIEIVLNTPLQEISRYSRLGEWQDYLFLSDTYANDPPQRNRLEDVALMQSLYRQLLDSVCDRVRFFLANTRTLFRHFMLEVGFVSSGIIDSFRNKNHQNMMLLPALWKDFLIESFHRLTTAHRFQWGVTDATNEVMVVLKDSVVCVSPIGALPEQCQELMLAQRAFSQISADTVKLLRKNRGNHILQEFELGTFFPHSTLELSHVNSLLRDRLIQAAKDHWSEYTTGEAEGIDCTSVSLSAPILFERDEFAELLPDQRQGLTSLASLIRSHEVYGLVVLGFASSDGLRDVNLRLALDRANFVKTELVKCGVQKDRITVKAFGENHFIQGIADGRSVRIALCDE